MSRKQQLQSADRGKCLRNGGMPSDCLADHQQSGAFDIWPRLWFNELRKLSHHGWLGWGLLRPQHYRLCVGGDAPFDPVRYLPHE